MPSKLKKAIGAVKDQTSIGLALVVNNYSSSLDIAVLKATTHDALPVDDKYVNEVLLLTSGSKTNAAACAQAIARRIGRTRNWIVALKSLMLVLRIFQDGDPYFPREVLHAMKGGAKILNLSSFRADSNSSPWDYTAFIRTFSLYLDERLECFLLGKLQRRAVYKEPTNHHHRSGSGFGGGRRINEPVRNMKPPMLLDRISYWQRLLERAIATRPTGAAKSHRLVHISLYSIVRESFDLYRDISDALRLLLDSFFHLQYQTCVDAFQTCIKVSKQFEELSGFYTLCKNIGVGRTSEYPSVQKISDELIDALREFLKDQSAFPAGNPRPTLQSAPMLLPADSLASTCGQVEHSKKVQFDTSEQPDEGFSETGSQLDAGTSPSISTDEDQFEKLSQLDDLMVCNTNKDTHETGADPSASPADQAGTVCGKRDLVPFNDDQQKSASGAAAVEQDQLEKQSQLDYLMGLNINMSTNEAGTSPSASPERRLDLVLLVNDDQQPSMSVAPAAVAEDGGREGWELMLVETANDVAVTTSSSQKGFAPAQASFEAGFDTSFLDSLYNQAPVLHRHQHQPQPSYNPFLDDTGGIFETSMIAHADNSQSPIVPVAGDTGFSSFPTFQATPTFCAQKSDDSTASKGHVENDPFAPLPPPQTDQRLCGCNNQQQHLLREQQLWFQHQNEIITRHANIT